MRTVALAGVVGLLGLAGLLERDSGAQSRPTVSLSVFRLYDSGNRVHRFQFNGTVSSRAAGEYVTVMRQTCGYSFATAIAGATSRAGGFWEVETPSAPRPGFDTNTYHARWGAARSKPVAFRGRLSMTVTKLGPRTFRIYVWRGEVQQDLSGRQVILQRLVNDSWTRVGAAKLTIDPKQYSSYAVSFTIPARGWTLRAVVPTKNARPCFNQSTTERFKS